MSLSNVGPGSVVDDLMVVGEVLLVVGVVLFVCILVLAWIDLTMRR